MTTLSKRRKALVEKIDRDKAYDAAEALALVKSGATAISTSRWTPR
jgi:DNA-binding GntR family transcriptional regulator